MLNIKVEFDILQALKTINKIEFYMQNKKSLLRKLAEFSEKRIVDRTKAGRNINQAFFKRYTPSYKLIRQKAGLSIRVNLFFAGTLLDSIRIKVERNKFILYFTGLQKDKAKWLHSGTKKMVARPFFALNSGDIKAITNLIYNDLEKRI